VWQYITLMKRIYLIDCPGVVPNNVHDTETDTVLKGVVRTENVPHPEDHIEAVLARVKPLHVQRTYGVRDWEDANDFLEKMAVRTGKLNKGGEPDVSTVAKMVLNDWMRGKLPHFVAPPGMEESKSAASAEDDEDEDETKGLGEDEEKEENDEEEEEEDEDEGEEELVDEKSDA
jgi:nuclear GTP-binding protein